MFLLLSLFCCVVWQRTKQKKKKTEKPKYDYFDIQYCIVFNYIKS